MKKERILIMNLGSTSSKIAVYDDETELFNDTLRHTDEEMACFEGVMDQFEFRKSKILEAMRVHGIEPDSITAAVSRGGMIGPCPHGAIKIDKAMIDYLCRPDELAKHASLLGSMIAYDMSMQYGIPACIYDAISTDEMQPLSRVSGVPELPHYSIGHMLNTRAMAINCAAEVLHKPFEECNIIVAHIGSGISTRLYKGGINIDSVNDDEGGFSTERGGRVRAKDLIAMCYSGKYTAEEVMAKFHKNGGLMAHLGTKDARDVMERISKGDAYAKIVFEAMALSLAKDIGTLSTVVCGKVDRIIITGGLAYAKYFTDYVTKHVSFIAPVEIMAGEYEIEALAAGALRVLRGEEQLQDFTEIMKTVNERTQIVPGLLPKTVPAR